MCLVAELMLATTQVNADDNAKRFKEGKLAKIACIMNVECLQKQYA